MVKRSDRRRRTIKSAVRRVRQVINNGWTVLSIPGKWSHVFSVGYWKKNRLPKRYKCPVMLKKIQDNQELDFKLSVKDWTEYR
jgi:hypothetical protein